MEGVFFGWFFFFEEEKKRDFKFFFFGFFFFWFFLKNANNIVGRPPLVTNVDAHKDKIINDKSLYSQN